VVARAGRSLRTTLGVRRSEDIVSA
jgi:hypothetical protein